MCIKYVFTYSLMIKNHRKLEAINHCKLLLDFTCSFTPRTYRTILWPEIALTLMRLILMILFVDLKKNLLSIKDPRTTAINDPHYWSHACYKKEIYGILSLFGSASCLLSSSSQLPVICHSSSPLGWAVFPGQRNIHIVVKGELQPKDPQTCREQTALSLCRSKAVLDIINDQSTLPLIHCLKNLSVLALFP